MTDAGPQTSNQPSRLTETTEFRKRYNRDYYRKHRPNQKLTTAELEKCLLDPRLIREIRGPGWIACVICGTLFKRLWARHFRSEDHLKVLEPIVEQLAATISYNGKKNDLLSLAFRKKFGLPKKFPLRAKNHAKDSASHLPMAGKGMRPCNEAARAKGWREWGVSPHGKRAQQRSALRNLSPNNGLAKSLRKPQKPPDVLLRKWALGGLSRRAIAAECHSRGLKMSLSWIDWRLKRMGIHRVQFSLFHGEIVGNDHLRLLIEDWGLVHHAWPDPPLRARAVGDKAFFTIHEVATLLGVPLDWVYAMSRRYAFQRSGVRGRVLGTAQMRFLYDELHERKRREMSRCAVAEALGITTRQLRKKLRTRIFSKKDGDAVIDVWTELKKNWRRAPAVEFAGRRKSSSGKSSKRAKLLPSEERTLHKRYRAVLADLKSLSNWLEGERKPKWPAISEWICEQAGYGRMRTLFFLPEFLPWAQEHDTDSRSGPGVGDRMRSQENS